MDEEDFFSDGAENDFIEPNYTVEETGARTSGTEVRPIDIVPSLSQLVYLRQITGNTEMKPEQIFISLFIQALFAREHVAIWPSSRQRIAGRLTLVKQDGVVFLAWQPNCRGLKTGKSPPQPMLSYR